MSDDEAEQSEDDGADGDPTESKPAFKKYMINVLTTNELD
jgi:hypothetical protein